MWSSIHPTIPPSLPLSLSFQPLPYAKPVEMNKTDSKPAWFSQHGGTSHSLLSHRFLWLVERPTAWPGGPLPRKLCGEDLSHWPRILFFCLSGSQTLLAGVSFPLTALPSRSSTVTSSLAQALNESKGHHCSHPWALASHVTPISSCVTQG